MVFDMSSNLQRRFWLELFPVVWCEDFVGEIPNAVLARVFSEICQLLADANPDLLAVTILDMVVEQRPRRETASGFASLGEHKKEGGAPPSTFSGSKWIEYTGAPLGERSDLAIFQETPFS
ncbi:MAG: hypothetical protein LAN61_05070 [Acidobacteriia bacterium]|nr:hypothetical protein [Terriglobia bacterium]